MAGFVFVLRVSAAFVAKAFESYAAHVGANCLSLPPDQRTYQGGQALILPPGYTFKLADHAMVFHHEPWH